MKHLLITNDFPPFWAGEAQYYYNIWNNLENKSDAIILCPKIPGYEVFDHNQPFTIYRARGLLFPGFLGRFIKPFIYLFWAVKIVRKHRDICLIHCGNILATFLAGMVICRFYKMPYFVYLHSEDLREYGKIKIIRDLFVKFLNNAKRVIVNSEFTKSRFLAKGVRKELFRMVHPGVDINKYYPMDASRIKEVYNLKDKKIILSGGRLVKRKGFDKVIESLPIVLTKVPNAILMIRGRGELEKTLRKLVKRYNLDNYIVFIGYVSDKDMPLYYNACDVFVMPSREYSGVDAEGFGIVFLEAGACQKPVVGGNSGGIPEVIINGRTGFLVNPLDIEEIADSVVKVLADSNLARQLGENARALINEKFQWKFSSQALESVLEEE